MNSVLSIYKPLRPCFLCHNGSGRKKKKYALPSGLVFYICVQCEKKLGKPFILDLLTKIPFDRQTYFSGKTIGREVIQ